MQVLSPAHPCSPAHPMQVLTSNSFLIGMLGILAASTFLLGLPAVINLYWIPYWLFVVWLDVVTYLHHHGSDNASEKMPWYRGEASRVSGYSVDLHAFVPPPPHAAAAHIVCSLTCRSGATCAAASPP